MIQKKGVFTQSESAFLEAVGCHLLMSHTSSALGGISVRASRASASEREGQEREREREREREMERVLNTIKIVQV